MTVSLGAPLFFRKGGFVKKNGLFVLHKGEVVLSVKDARGFTHKEVVDHLKKLALKKKSSKKK